MLWLRGIPLAYVTIQLIQPSHDIAIDFATVDHGRVADGTHSILVAGCEVILRNEAALAKLHPAMFNFAPARDVQLIRLRNHDFSASTPNVLRLPAI